jgi:hypothetical protein
MIMNDGEPNGVNGKALGKLLRKAIMPMTGQFNRKLLEILQSNSDSSNTSFVSE